MCRSEVSHTCSTILQFSHVSLVRLQNTYFIRTWNVEAAMILTTGALFAFFPHFWHVSSMFGTFPASSAVLKVMVYVLQPYNIVCISSTKFGCTECTTPQCQSLSFLFERRHVPSQILLIGTKRSHLQHNAVCICERLKKNKKKTLRLIEVKPKKQTLQGCGSVQKYYTVYSAKSG